MPKRLGSQVKETLEDIAVESGKTQFEQVEGQVIAVRLKMDSTVSHPHKDQ